MVKVETLDHGISLACVVALTHIMMLNTLAVPPCKLLLKVAHLPAEI